MLNRCYLALSLNGVNLQELTSWFILPGVFASGFHLSVLLFWTGFVAVCWTEAYKQIGKCREFYLRV